MPEILNPNLPAFMLRLMCAYEFASAAVIVNAREYQCSTMKTGGCVALLTSWKLTRRNDVNAL